MAASKLRSVLGAVSLSLGGALAIAAPAQAQDSGESRDLLVTIGGGGQYYPRYPGADHLDLFPMPIVNFRKDGRPLPFEAPDEGIGFGVLGADSPVDFGPAVQLQNSRRDKDVGAPVGKVGFTVEAGAFVQAWLGRSLRVRAEGRRGFGGHKAWLGDLSADFVQRDGDTTLFSIGPRLRLSSARYQRAYFGVTPAAAAATGLAAYRPDGGAHAVGLVSSLTHQFSPSWGIHGYAGYDRLIANAADSPLVRRYGSRDQFSGGLGLTYTFRVHRKPR